MPSRRTILLALLALAVPLPAFALSGGETSEPAGISVSASLGDCGLAESRIVCQIDASWNAVEGADYYTVSVVQANGSVTDYGQVSGTGTSLWVPYVGAGTYSVQVSAWGTPPGEEKARVIARDRSTSSERFERSALDRSGEAGEDEATHEAGEASEVPDEDAAGHEPAGEAPPEEPAEEPVCVEPPVEEPVTEDPASAETSEGDTAQAEAAEAAALAAEPPPADECP